MGNVIKVYNSLSFVDPNKAYFNGYSCVAEPDVEYGFGSWNISVFPI